MVQLTDFPDEPETRLRLLPQWPLVRKVAYLGSFVILAMLTQFFVNAADTLMLGRLEQAEATASTAAIGLGMPMYWAIGGFFAALSYGTQAMTGRRYAEGEDRRAGRVLYNAVFVSLFAGALGTVIGWFGSPLAMDFLAEASPEQRVLGTTYVQLRVLGIAGMVITFAFKAFFDGIGRTYVHLLAAVVMNVVNIALNYVLIYGNDALGVPAMKIAGAGLASMISTYIGLGIMIAVTLLPRYGYNRRFRFIERGKARANLDLGIIRTIVKLMLPAGSATLILMTGFLLFLKFVGQLDAGTGAETFTAATKVIMDIAAICFMPLLAFGTATATAVAQSLGAGKPNLAARYAWDSVRVGILAMIPFGVAFVLFPEQIISLWAPNDPAVAAAGATPLRLIASSLPMLVVALILSQSLYGAGANVYVMVAEGLLHFGCLVPLSWFLGPYLGLGLNGIWTAALIYVVGLGIAMGGKFLAKGWRTIEL